MADKYRYFDWVTYKPFDEVYQKLNEEGGDFLISPIHKADSEVKKKHLHVMYAHGNTIAPKAARDILLPLRLAANDYIVAVQHPRNRMRYYLHLDDPDKEQFPEGASALTIVRNFPLDLTKPLSEEERRQLPIRVIDFIADYNISEYKELIDALKNYDYELFQFAYTHTIFLGRYLDSKRFGGSENNA